MQTARRNVIFTYEDYLHIPGDKRYELIGGDLSMVPAPLTSHQLVLFNLGILLRQHVAERDLGCCFIAPVDVLLSDIDVVQPDVLYIAKARQGIVTEKNIQGAPDLVMEILSPTSKSMDRDIKRKLYEKFGVREYWIVDPVARSVEIFHMTDEGFERLQVYTSGSHAKSRLLEGFSPAVDAIFAR